MTPAVEDSVTYWLTAPLTGHSEEFLDQKYSELTGQAPRSGQNLEIPTYLATQMTRLDEIHPYFEGFLHDLLNGHKIVPKS